jgi:hypothetical protein
VNEPEKDINEWLKEPEKETHLKAMHLKEILCLHGPALDFKKLNF